MGIFFLDHIIKLKFFILGHFFSFQILSSIYYQKLKEKKTFRDFRVFDFGYRAKAKTHKSPKLFFYIKAHHIKTAMCQTVSIHQQHLKFLVTEVFKSTSWIKPQFK